MANRLNDLTGKRYGRLLVVSHAETRRNARWMCRCDCGTRKIVDSVALRLGRTKSCGCTAREEQTKTRERNKANGLRNDADQ